MPPAIRVQHLSKRYQIGVRDPMNGSFRDMLVAFVRAPVRRLRRLSGSAEEGWFWALGGVDFEVQPGEVLGIIGRNGAGKSTLLKILSRITEPTTGRVELRGRVASLLEVGTGFHPDLTGRENIYLNGAILGMPRADIRRKFEAIVEFAEVGRFVDTAIKHYSSGMYLRLAFSVAAHLDSEILLVDEVLAVGDVAFQKKCLGKMHDVSRGGRTVVFISHNMMAVASLCQSGLVLEAGRVRDASDIQSAIRTYLQTVTDAGAQGWDVSGVSRNHEYGELMTFTRIEAHPAERDGFRFGEELRFRLYFKADATLTPVFVGAGIDDAFGHRLATFESHEIGFSLDVERGCEYSVDLRIPQPYLNPGRYFLSVSLVSGQHYFDLLMHAAQFDVNPIDAVTGEYFEAIPGAGSLRLPYSWRHAGAFDPHAVVAATAGERP